MPKPRKPQAGKTNAGLPAPADQLSVAQALLQGSGSGVYIIQDKSFIYVSPYFTELSGYSLQDLEGINSLELVHPADRDSVRKQSIADLKHGWTLHPYEYRFIKKNGKPMWVIERVSSIEYRGRRAALGSFMNISRSKDLEDELARSEQRHRAILDQMHDACFEVALDGKFVFINNYLSRSLQYKHDELIGRHYREIIPEGEAGAVYETLRQVYETGNPDTALIHKVRRKDGLEFYVESSISLTRDEHGKPSGFICVGRDINERKRLEQALVRSEERALNILQRMQDSYYEVDLDGNFTFINEATSRDLLYTREELIGSGYNKIMSEEEARRVFAVFHQVFLTGEPNPGFAHKVIKKDGTTGYAESSISLLRNESGNPVGFNSVSRDVTQRKQLEMLLQQSEERYRTILEEMQDSYFEVDLAGNFTYVNNAVCTNMLHSAEEITGSNYTTHVPPEDARALFKAFSEVFRTGVPKSFFEHGLMRKDGCILFASTSIALRRDGSGKPIGFRSVSRDVSERKKLEEELRRSEERFRTILENMQDSYFEVDLKGNFTFINLSASSRMGYSRDELLGKNFRMTTPGDDVANQLAAFNEVFKTGIPNPCFLHKHRCKDGSIISVESSIGLLHDERGNIIGFNSVSRDVTQRLEFEQRLADMATHDFLTGLPNRVLLHDRLHVSLAQAKRNKNMLAILTLDLNKFKAVNDTFGHHVGDELLKAVGQRLTGLIRSGDTIARMGGDEFMLLLPELHRREDVATITSKLVDAFKSSFIIEGHRLNISCSIGIAVFPDNGSDVDSLMKKSDSAMYDIKKHGPSSPRQS
jgi:diguanylate cyclase (GGDEF)-like protein/PAS domain S-box-containing protein